MQARSRDTLVEKSSKVRRVAYVAKPTGTRSSRPDDKARVEHRDEHATTADLSERKHEEFSRGSGKPAQRRMSFAIGINHLLGNFSQQYASCSDGHSHTYDACSKKWRDAAALSEQSVGIVRLNPNA
jgi:hypothetical protein